MADIYRQTVGPLLARDDGADPELLSLLSLRLLGWVSRHREGLPRPLLEAVAHALGRPDPRLRLDCFGVSFANPVGLAAGFDKNGVAAAIWHCFGFGFAELGTLTCQPQQGNPRPRLFRLAAEQAALNRMGFNNVGSAAAVQVLEAQHLPAVGQRPLPLGLNLGKSKLTPLQAAPDDYAVSLGRLARFADYVTINVSSPNTPGLRQLQAADALRSLVERLRRQDCGAGGCPPLLVKIAPDLRDSELDAIADLALDLDLAGLIATNTSWDRLGLEQRRLLTGRTLAEEPGGLSGAPIRARSLAVLQRLATRLAGRLPLIGVGGIDSPQAAWQRIAAGASLLQLYTGWIYRGPELVPRILEGLLTQLEAHGLPSISAAVGCGLPWTKPSR
ncbi:MAG: quinone-dependent dihydroorotate dehydrogenase [Aphanocapsa feldmannii 288cV]|nr:MAG: quinone-dependent dihydroorotate dehydrogenase [Aphanocapsa feldmannii 288cV]